MAPQDIVALECPEADGNRAIASGLDTAHLEAEAVRLRRNSYHEYKFDQIQNLLRTALESKHAIDLESYKRTDPYSEPEPLPPRYLEYPREPQADEPSFRPASGPGLLSGSAECEQKRREAYEIYVRVYTAWAETVKKVEAENQKRYADSVAAVEHWNTESRKHRLAQAAYNDAIDRRIADFQGRVPETVEGYCRQVLSTSPFPDSFQRQFELQYLPQTRTLIVDHLLPLPDSLPRVKGLKYVKAQDRFVEDRLSATALNRLYAAMLHQICVRTLYELFDGDIAGALNTVAFNGWIETTDPSAGDKTRSCLLSVQATKAQFQSLNLWDTDAKAAFKALRGLAHAKLHAPTPVTPVLSRAP
jgi:restriction system protein